MTRRLDGAEFSALFRTFEQTAFRLETRDAYAVSYEREAFDQFLAGKRTPPTELDWWRPWLDHIAELTRQGRRVERVRLLAEPPTDYQRWELWGGQWNTRAGEEIRYLARTKAVDLGIPVDVDWWLFDSAWLVLMHFDTAGSPTGKELVVDPAIVAEHCRWRDLAFRHAASAGGLAPA